MIDGWMTVKEVMVWLNITRGYVYVCADKYKWLTCTVGSTRLYAENDVKDTPSADERKRIGYEQRSKNNCSTHVEQSINGD